MKQDVEKYNIMSDIFNENGMFKLNGYDPYHTQTQDGSLIRDILFDWDGNAPYDMIDEAIKFANKHNCAWNSDIAKYIICERISSVTKGNYTDISLWR